MSQWREGDWKSEMPGIDAEHRKLHEMVRSMTAVVMNDPQINLASEAVGVLRERLRIHFAMEEEIAGRIDPESCAILREDHKLLAEMLDRVWDSVAEKNGSETRSRLSQFNTALSKHDAEIDVPLFKIMAKA
ncbi:conserved hypothetical protein [Candidatus Terasakiella magnetica]|nr:conserved hypothetical protein [Candidatus Terasakiella magnetica]